MSWIRQYGDDDKISKLLHELLDFINSYELSSELSSETIQSNWKSHMEYYSKKLNKLLYHDSYFMYCKVKKINFFIVKQLITRLHNKGKETNNLLIILNYIYSYHPHSDDNKYCLIQ